MNNFIISHRNLLSIVFYRLDLSGSLTVSNHRNWWSVNITISWNNYNCFIWKLDVAPHMLQINIIQIRPKKQIVIIWPEQHFHFFKVKGTFGANKLLNLKFTSLTSNQYIPTRHMFRQPRCYLLGANPKSELNLLQEDDNLLVETCVKQV